MEQAILRELEAFILEMGSDFAFVARQKRITVDNEDYYLDLLFYHRRLRRLVAIELKLGTLPGRRQGTDGTVSPLAGEIRVRPGEEPPLGLILCADKSEEHVELLQLDKSGIRVAQYLTELPPRELLEKTLHDSIRRRVQRLALAEEDGSAETAQICSGRSPVTGGETKNQERTERIPSTTRRATPSGPARPGRVRVRRRSAASPTPRPGASTGRGAPPA